MSRTYCANHPAKFLEINFNQKLWRQDFAEFIKNKLSWDCDAFVSRVKSIKKTSIKSVKCFEIMNLKGEIIYFEFLNLRDILTNNKDLVEEYLNLRGCKNAA